jgi:hypothetical protein
MIYAPRIELCRTIGSLGLLHRRSRDAHSFLSHGSPSLLLHHDGRVDVIDVWMVKRPRRLARHTLSQAWVLNSRFGFLYGINSGKRGAELLTFLFQCPMSWNRKIAFTHC